jgi:hypothetical protein
LAYSDHNSFVYENKEPLPRAFIAHEAIPVQSGEEALALLQGRSFDPARTVIIEAETTLPALPIAPPSVSSTATIINQDPQLVEIEAKSSNDGYLVLLDTFYPGWEATIDGQSTPIYPANFIGRAVFVPAGEHIVRFMYRPLSFRLGLGLSLGMTVILALTALVSRSTLFDSPVK